MSTCRCSFNTDLGVHDYDLHNDEMAVPPEARQNVTTPHPNFGAMTRGACRQIVHGEAECVSITCILVETFMDTCER